MRNEGPSKKLGVNIPIQGGEYRWVPEIQGRGYWAKAPDRKVRVFPPQRGMGQTWRVWVMKTSGDVGLQAEFNCPDGTELAMTTAFSYAKTVQVHVLFPERVA